MVDENISRWVNNHWGAAGGYVRMPGPARMGWRMSLCMSLCFAALGWRVGGFMAGAACGVLGYTWAPSVAQRGMWLAWMALKGRRSTPSWTLWGTAAKACQRLALVHVLIYFLSYQSTKVKAMEATSKWKAGDAKAEKPNRAFCQSRYESDHRKWLI